MSRSIRYPAEIAAICLILTLILLTIAVTIEAGMQRHIPEPSRLHLYSICGAIANLKHHLNPYVCPEEIFKKLYGVDYKSDDAINMLHAVYYDMTLQDINLILQRAAESPLGASNSYFTSGETDAGYFDFARLAFAIFGFKAESLLYLYWLLFLISVSLFFVTFRQNSFACFLLILFLFGHYVIVKGASDVGYNLGNVTNYRFIPVLAILPVLHVSLVSFSAYPLPGHAWFTVFLQICLVLFAFWVRNSAIWALFFLTFLIVTKCAVEFIQKDRLFGQALRERVRRSSICHKIQKMRSWALNLSLVSFLLLLLAKPFVLGNIYDQNMSTGYHVVWHNIYIGLAFHPTIRQEFSDIRLSENDDMDSYFQQIIGPKAGLRANFAPGSEDSHYKAAIRGWLRRHPEIINNWLFKRALLLKKEFGSEEYDQYAYNAAFKWLEAHNLSTFYFFNFNAKDKVDYVAAFPNWFKDRNANPIRSLPKIEPSKHETPSTAKIHEKRKFKWETDMKWPVYDRILAKVTKEVLWKYPWEVLQTILFIKPIIFFLNYFSYFALVQNLPPIGLIIAIAAHVTLTQGKAYQSEQWLRLFLFLGLLFLFCMLPSIVVYPAAYVIADSSLILTLLILTCFFWLFSTLASKIFRLNLSRV